MKKLCLIIIPLILATGCEEKPRPTRSQPGVALVETTLVTISPLQTERIVTGSLEAETSVRLFNQEEGRIIELPYYEGDVIKQDTLLIRIDDRLLQAELNKAQANLKQAQVDVKRLKTLLAKKVVSEDELVRAQTALKLARAELNLLETRLTHTRIKAPFDGIISERRNEPGDVVSVHSHILSMIDPAALKVVVSVSELLLANIHLGDAVEVRIDALGEKFYTANVSRIYPTIDPNTRKGILEARLQNLPEGARPGQLCRVRISTETLPRLNVSFAAVRYDSQGEYVYQVNDENKIEKVRVQTGIQLGNQVEIIDGLQAGGRVVVKGFIGLKSGASVKPVESSSPADQTGKRVQTQ